MGNSSTATPFWINAALRSAIWFGAALALAYFKKPDGASVFDVRTDSVGAIGGLIVLFAVALHGWSTVILALGERQGEAATAPVADGPFRYMRNPIYVAGITLLLGVGLLYPAWGPRDLVLQVLLALYFHGAVVLVEEPELRRRFGASYERYCEQVPRWLPGWRRDHS